MRGAEPWGMRYPFPLIVLLSLCSMIMYTMRWNVTVALNGDSCKADVAEQYGWSNEEKGLVFSGFFWGYCFMQVPGGLAATRYGGKTVLALAMLGTAFFTAIVPWVASPNVLWLVLTRCACGLCQASLYPAWASMVAVHLPEKRRNLSSASFAAGSSIGVVVAWLVLPRVQSHLGWEYCFYLPAALGGVWLVIWVAVAPNQPRQTHGEATESAKLLPDTAASGARGGGSAREPPESKAAMPLGKWFIMMLTAPAMWGVYLAGIAASFVFYTLLSFLPEYMKQRYDLDLADAAEVSVYPYVLRAAVLVVAGPLVDWMLGLGVRASWIRKGLSFAALGVPAVALLIMAVSDQSEAVAVTLLVIGVGASGMINVGFMFAPIEMYPDSAGAAFAMNNVFSNIPGFVAPPLVGWLLDKGGCPKVSSSDCNSTETAHPTHPHVDITPECQQAWNTVFLIAVVMSFLGGLSYAILGARHPVYDRPSPKSKIVGSIQ